MCAVCVCAVSAKKRRPDMDYLLIDLNLLKAEGEETGSPPTSARQGEQLGSG